MHGEELATEVLERLRSICGPDRPVPLHEPSISDDEIRSVTECLRSGWVSTAGPASAAFEERLREITGAPHVVAVTNGTAALHLALLLAGVEPGDAVLSPALTFVATTNAIHYCGAVPHFVDSESETFGVDARALRAHLERTTTRDGDRLLDRETGRPIRALMAVHVFGHPADLDGLAGLCDDFGLALIEDAAEALGSYDRDVHVGNRGPVAALSFNGNKIVTTGGGGAVLCGDDALAERARHLSTTARVPHPWEASHDAIGFNYRLPAVNAALGVAQIERLDGFLAAKRALALRYVEAFDSLDGVSILREPAHCRSNYWLNALVLDRPDRAVRDAILRATNEDGIHTRPAWTLSSRLPMYAGCPRMPLDGAEAIVDRVVSLPSSPGLALAQNA